MPESKQQQTKRERAPFPKQISGGGIVLALTHDEVYFETVGARAEHEVRELLQRHKLEVQTHRTPPFSKNFHEAFPACHWARVTGGERVDAVVAALEADERVRLASPVYHRPDLPFKTALTFSDRVLVKTQPGVNVKQLAAGAYEEGEAGATVSDEVAQAHELLARVTVADARRENALECAERMGRQKDVREAHPDWFSLISALAAVIPDDPLFPKEWDMTQIGAPQGWSLSEGSANVIIAIIDTGCDLGHEDLVAKYVPVANRFNVVTGTNSPDDDFGHGTCCASLAAAATNNALGTAGVGWNCLVMPIKLLNFGFILSELDIVKAIHWARTNFANVVSMSWYWPGTTASADPAFAFAAAHNIVLVAASGNFSGPIIWPAIHPDIMAIGASDQIDHLKSPASPDGECWGSNFGPQQSVMAPGVRCWAANNTNGGASFNDVGGGPISWACVAYPSAGTADQKYFALMNGTSAATPHVAGLAGLLLAVDPSLERRQVRRIIEETADKTGGYAYAVDPLHPNGTWNQTPGYGRINVFNALKVLFPHVATSIAAGGFGYVCVGSFADEILTINNTGAFGKLRITEIKSTSPDFLAPSVLSYPLVVNPGDSIEVVIRFQPTTPLAGAGNIEIFSNDPASPHVVPVFGHARTPRLSLMIADTGNFGKACVGSFKDEALVLNNSGKCALTVTDVTSSSPEFLVPSVTTYPLSISGGGFLPVPIRFQPTSLGAHHATITVFSDDPAGPKSVHVSGTAPAGHLVITGSVHFGGVKCGTHEQRTLTLCNEGDCDLRVTHVGLKHKRRHLRIVSNPFPATIRPGSGLGVVLEYFADERIPKPSELIIKSDDPHHHIETRDVLAYTIWDCCCEKSCNEPCKCGCGQRQRHDEDVFEEAEVEVDG